MLSQASAAAAAPVVSEPKESNIAVVVRVRPRSAKEVRENSPLVVATTQNRRELVLRPDGVPAAAKTFNFDRVFGPDVPQQTVFDEVVAAMLAEVLLGFNCTIFAYGQTGTGKTYTMEGDLSAPRGKDAGIIPRALLALFDTLERETAEFSVRASFMELYNEELKDLLSQDDDPRKLKVFEDLSRKGSVVIQGLEELIVKSADDVIAILQLGSNRRQTAATKMNQVSSRSHAIFSITVHTKECTPDGEELLKVGKLNLVDLAGSENIGRSGAENKRAKEAGMINQSLLTLGRVINALVERSPHIPYRESKLTRILQDSLGGKTKTCIVAAISPAKCNIEETLSTLDYAHRAKNIRNKPEANQRMTKKALIREYINEIERLKADLAATREKNGIFMSKDNYNTLMDEVQSRKDRIEEMSSTITSKEERLVAVEEQFRQKTDLLNKTSAQLSKAQSELDSKRTELETAIAEARELHRRFVEQEHLTRAHAHTETHLDAVAGMLVSTLKSSVHDIEGLHDKIDRKRSLEQENQQLFSDLQDRVYSHLEGVEARVNAFGSQLGTFQTRLSSCFGDVLEATRRHFDGVRNKITETAQHMSSSQDEMEAKVQSMAKASQSTVKQTVDDVHFIETVFTNHESVILDMLSGLCNNLVLALQQQQQDLTRISAGLHEDAEVLSLNVCDALSNALDARDKHLQQTLQSLESHQQKLQQQTELQKKRQYEDVQHLRVIKDECLSRITGSLDELFGSVLNRTHEQHEDTMQKNSECSEHIKRISDQVHKRHDEETDMLAEVRKRAKLGSDAAATRHAELDKAAESHASRVNSVLKSLIPQTHDITSKTRSAIAANKNSIVSSLQTHANVVTDFIDAHNNHMNIYRSAKQSMLMHIDETLVSSDTSNASHREQIATLVDDENQALSQTLTDVHTSITDIRAYLDNHELRTDVPTGKTPRRRAIRFPTSWIRTKNHDVLLEEFRKDPDTAMMAMSQPISHELHGMAMSASESTLVASSSVDDMDNHDAYMDDTETETTQNVSCALALDMSTMSGGVETSIDPPSTSAHASNNAGVLSKLPRVRPRRHGGNAHHSVAFRDVQDE